MKSTAGQGITISTPAARRKTSSMVYSFRRSQSTVDQSRSTVGVGGAIAAAAAAGATLTGTVAFVVAGGTALAGAEATLEPSDAVAAANDAISTIARLTIKIHPTASTSGNHGTLRKALRIADLLSFAPSLRVSSTSRGRGRFQLASIRRG